MNMSERVALALTDCGRSPRDLSKDIGVSVARISQLKSGTGGVKAENLFAFARATGYSPQWLAEGVGNAKESPTSAPEYTMIARYESSAHDESSSGALAFDRAWLQALSLNERSLMYFYFSDGTMEPAVIHGDLLLIDINQVTPESGGIFVVLRADGEAVVKRLLQTMASGWIIRSDNDNKRHYPDEIINDDEIGTLRIAGRVVWRGGKI
jgi:phage repressor protein C with HTH and peptisase S24 domain